MPWIHLSIIIRRNAFLKSQLQCNTVDPLPTSIWISKINSKFFPIEQHIFWTIFELNFCSDLNRVTVNCSKDWHNIYIYKDRTILPNMIRPKRDDDFPPVSGVMLESKRRKRSYDSIDQNGDVVNAKCNQIRLPMTMAKMDGFSYYNFSVWYIYIFNSIFICSIFMTFLFVS